MLYFLPTKISTRIKIRITNEKRKCLNCKDKLDLSSFIVMFFHLILPKSKELFRYYT